MTEANIKTAPFRAVLYLLVCALLLCGCAGDNAALVSKDESSEEQSLEASAKQGFGLYIDGRFIAACDNAEVIGESLSELTELLALSYGVSPKGSRLTNDVRVVEDEYGTECFTNADGLLKMLGVTESGVSFSVLDFHGVETDVVAEIITVSTVFKEEVAEAQVLVKETDLLDKGETLVITEAHDGKLVNTYVRTAKNGVTVSEELVRTVVSEEPVSGEEWVGAANGATLMSVGDKLMLPYDGRISSPYGWRIIWGSSEFHKGIDLIAHEGGCYGDPIYAAEDGVVSFADRRGGFGRLVEISHSQSTKTLYAHCSELLVEEGDTVKKGDVIALVGNSGKVTGAHLHFEVQVNGESVDPQPMIDWASFN